MNERASRMGERVRNALTPLDFNEAEARALEALGAEVTVVRGTEPALRLLE